jgi:formate hydrogenlyase subunit 3/multisubunit Na+/H+ antiporter MnhD subunit
MSEADTVGLILILIFIIILAMVRLYEITYEKEQSLKGDEKMNIFMLFITIFHTRHA